MVEVEGRGTLWDIEVSHFGGACQVFESISDAVSHYGGSRT